MYNLYASFDVFPSSKGSSTHIKEMITELAEHSKELKLLCLRGNRKTPTIQKHNNILIKRYYTEEELNYLEKALLYAEKVHYEVATSKVDIAHFRDVWSGLGVIADSNLKSVFEVNALTSIELPYRYPNLTEEFLEKLKTIEQKCLDQSSVIITPSKITKEFLINEFNIEDSKIEVIQNGTHITREFVKPEDAPKEYLIYFGALQPWQGITTLLKALTYLLDYSELKLMICSSIKEKAFKPLIKLIDKLELTDRIIYKSELRREELVNYIHYAKLSIAPLSACSRNITQGCSPLKVVETMGCKTALVASDLPVVREFISENEAMLFEPDRELDLARCIRFLLDSPEERKRLADNAFMKVEKELTWELQKKKLALIYKSLSK